MVEHNLTSSFIQSMQRDLNCLTDPDRGTRRRALERLHKHLILGDPGVPQPSLETLQAVWDNIVLRMVLKVLNDSVEKCRELAILMIIGVAKKVHQVEQTTLLAVPVLANRIGHVPVLEDSEEIRLLYINLLSDILIAKCSVETIQLVLEPLLKVLYASIGDPFHEIKKASSKAIVSLVERSKDLLGEKPELVLKALYPNINHSHSRVRIATLQAIDGVMRCNLPPGVVAESLVPNVRALAFDRTTRVREIFFECIARWLGYEKEVVGGLQLCLKEGRDPRTHIPQLLPLLLLGVSDQSGDVAASSLLLVERVGDVYKVFKNSKLFSTDKVELIVDQDLAHGITGFDNVENSSKKSNKNTDECCDGKPFPPPFKARPSKGGRVLIQDFFGQLVRPVLRDLREWTTITRVGAARLLHTLLVLAERKATPYLDLLIPSLCSAVGDDDLVVAQHIVEAMHVLGYHVSLDDWLPLVMDHVTSSLATPPLVANTLVLLSGLLYRTPTQTMNKLMVLQISNGLYQLNIGFNEHPAVRHQLLAVLNNLIRVGGSLCESSSFEILLLLLQLQYSESDIKLKQNAKDLEVVLARVLGLTSSKELYVRHLERLIVVTTTGHEEWTGSSPGRYLFQVFIQNAGGVVSSNLQGLLQLFTDCLHQDRDPALRISFLQLLDELFEIPEMASSWSSFALQVIGSIIIPCGVWQVGKVGAAIRHAAMVALGTFLRRDLCSKVELVSLLQSDQLLAVAASCLEEDYYVDTRRVTCHVMENILRIAGSALNEEQGNEIRNALQKRLDDSSDNVRLGIIPAITAFFANMPESCSDTIIKSFMSTVLLHMDDPNQQIQKAVYKAAEVCAIRKPAVVEEVVKSVRERQQMTEYWDNLLAQAAFFKITQDNQSGLLQ